MKLTITYAVLLSVLFVSCKKSDTNEDSEARQTERIEKYIKSNYPTYEVIDGVHRASVNKQPTVGDRISLDDSVAIRYSIYTFYSKIDSLVTTNIESEALKHGFDRSVMNLSPLEIKYGETSLFEGLNIGLRDLKVQDSVYLFVPSNLAYGKKINGIVSKNNSLAVFVTIISIKKN